MLDGEPFQPKDEGVEVSRLGGVIDDERERWSHRYHGLRRTPRGRVVCGVFSRTTSRYRSWPAASAALIEAYLIEDPATSTPSGSTIRHCHRWDDGSATATKCMYDNGRNAHATELWRG